MSILLIEYQYFGTVDYYKTLFQFSNIKFEEYESYQKGSFRNRTLIPGANGVMNLSVPLQKGRDQKALFREIKIDYREKWIVQHMRALDASYNRAPFYEYYRDGIREMLSQEEMYLMSLDRKLVAWVLKMLKAKPVISATDEFIHVVDQDTVDARNTILPSKNPDWDLPEYDQVFKDRIDFKPHMSILDLLFCNGPASAGLLKSSNSRF